MVKLTKKLVLGRARADNLESVKNLNCWASDLADVSVLRQMHNLEVVNVSANSIETLQDFSHCPSLREIYLRKNNIKGLNQVLHLKRLSQLRLLWLSDNPCCSCAEDTKYRLTVLKALPNLLKLDNIVVTPEEVERAKEEGEELEPPQELETEILPDLQEIPVNVKDDDTESDLNNQVEKPEVNEKLHLRRIPSENDDRSDLATANSCEESIEDSMTAETNRLRKELGLRPLLRPTHAKTPPRVHMPFVQRTNISNENPPRNRHSNNILAASLALVQELDVEGLRTLQDAIHEKLQLTCQSTEYTSLRDEQQTLERSVLSNGTIYSQSSSGDRSLVEQT